MKLFEYIRLALTEIWHNKVRTFLTLIGIIIGIAAVMIIIYGVQLAGDYILEEFNSVLPADLINVYPAYDSDTGRSLVELKAEDVNYIKNELGDGIRAIAASGWERTAGLQYGGREYDCRLIPTTYMYMDVYGMDIAQGRFLNIFDSENNNAVIVLGYETAEELFGDEKAVGKKVRLFNSITCTVVGVLSEEYQSPIMGSAASANNTRGFIPLSLMQRLVKNYSSNFLIRVKDQSTIDDFQKKIINTLSKRYGLTKEGKPKVDAYNYGSMIEQIGIVKIVLIILLGGVASITLLVAGIGIMNIMLVIVAERTKEIGLRKALGATRKDIMLQFIIESIILCLVGGVLGIIAGYSGSSLIDVLGQQYLQGVDASLPLWSILLALTFTTAVGLFFGIYPASQAARLDPIEALHYE